jgi:two-component system, NarL family, capsular synthesis sensor histidine kinase RcsC
MFPISRRGPLGQLQYYQRLAMFGGGLIITLVVLLALVLDTISTVRGRIADEREEVFVGGGLLSSEIEASEAALRSSVHSAELLWSERTIAKPALVKRFYDNGQELALPSPPPQRSQLVLGTPDDLPSREELARYLGLTEQLSRLQAVNSLTRDGMLTGYYYSIKGDLVTLVPVPETVDARSLGVLRDRSRLLEALGSDLGELAHKPMYDAKNGLRTVLWTKPLVNPVTNTRELRLAATAFSGAKPFAVFVTAYPDDILTAPLSMNRYDGVFMIVSRDKSLIATASSHESDQPLIGNVLREIHTYTASKYSVEHYHDGVFSISAPLHETGWILIYAFSWRDIARAVAWPVGTVAATTLAILGVLWSVILLFQRHIFAPVLERSQRVFESEHLNRKLVETVPVGLAVISPETCRSLLSSPVMSDVASRVMVDAPTLYAVFVGRYIEHAKGRYRIARKWKSNVADDDLTLPLRDGGYIDLAVSAVRARYGGEDVLVTAFIDVTTKKQLEQTLRDAKQAADLANAAKSAFLAAISHEIRTPLNAILGNLELLSRSSLNPIQQDRLETIRTSSVGLLGIVSDVLDISKIEAGEMTLEAIDFDLVEVVERSLTIFAPLAREKGLSLYGEFRCRTVQYAMGDPTRFGQIVHNLLGNAIKFTRVGKVTLRLEIVHPPVGIGGTVVVVVEDTGIGMSPAQCSTVFRPFSQADSSINRRFGGAGLGLALCRHLADAMGGTIEVSSELHVGSRFTVRLPFGSDEASAEEVQLFSGTSVVLLSASDEWIDFTVPHLKTWGLHVHVRRHPMFVTGDELATAGALLIFSDQRVWQDSEENRLVDAAIYVIDIHHEGPVQPLGTGKVMSVSCYSIKGLKRALREALTGEAAIRARDSCGHTASDEPHGLSRYLRVLVAEDNPANRALLAEQLKLLGCDAHVVGSGEDALRELVEGKWDLLLTDLNMPIMSGYELARVVHARYPELPIFVATADATIEERAQCETIGISRVLIKPLSLEHLLSALAVVADENNATVAALPEETGLSIPSRKPVPEHLRITFMESCLASLATIRAREAADDGPGIAAELHSLRGALGVFGQKHLAEKCGEIEEYVKGKGSVGLPELFAELERAVRDLFKN